MLMKKIFKLLLSAVAAGICIGIGGTVFVSLGATQKIIGAFLFALGLFTIICYQFSLFTGKVGYVFENKISYLLDLSIIWVGNFIGTALVAILFRQTRFFTPELHSYVDTIVNAKVEDNIFSIFVLALFCGVLMYIAVNTQKKENVKSGFKLLAIFACVAVFILCGFEHVVANMYYVTLSGDWSFKIIGYLFIMTLGNSCGSFIMWGFEKILTDKKEKAE